MNAKRSTPPPAEVEEPVKNSPTLIASLIGLLLFFLVTGVVLVSWYSENVQEEGLADNLNRVLVSGIADLVLIVLLSVVLANLLRRNRKNTPKKRVSGAKKTVKKRVAPTRKKIPKTS